MRVQLLMILLVVSGFAGCCLLPGHDVRDFFTGRVVKERPSIEELAGTYAVVVDNRTNTDPILVTELVLGVDGSATVAGDLSIFGSRDDRSGDSGSKGMWTLRQVDQDGVWAVELTLEGLPGASWYVLRYRDDLRLGKFHGDPDIGEIVELEMIKADEE